MITLLALQVILLLWFIMIIRVAIKVIRGGEADDSRSEDEDSGEEEGDEEVHYPEKYHTNGSIDTHPHEKEVGVEDINVCVSYQRSTPSRKFRKSGGTASGVTLPSDRKELLGRIGCDKGS